MTEEEEGIEYRQTPQSDIDLQMILTDPKWGSAQIPIELREKLKAVIGEWEEEEGGKKVIHPVTEQLWGLLSFYTRDVRLANLSAFSGEVDYVRYFLDLAGDCLREGYIKSFLKSLSLAVTVLETSQSKGGFLRKRHGTISKEEIKGELEPPKKGLLATKKRED